VTLLLGTSVISIISWQGSCQNVTTYLTAYSTTFTTTHTTTTYTTYTTTYTTVFTTTSLYTTTTGSPELWYISGTRIVRVTITPTMLPPTHYTTYTFTGPTTLWYLDVTITPTTTMTITAPLEMWFTMGLTTETIAVPLQKTGTMRETRTRALVLTSIGPFTSLIQTMVTETVAPSIMGMLVVVLGVGVGACALVFFMKRVKHPSQSTQPSAPTVTEKLVTKTKHCPECGLVMPLEAKHCPKCGTKQYYYGSP